MALMTARRERWKGRSLDQVAFSKNGMPFASVTADVSSRLTPDQAALQGEISQILRQVIEQELTDKQRQVLMLMVFHEVPMDEVVQQLGTNRNAIYKMLHDARRKLKSNLQARGFEVSELLSLFHESR
jgi:RNA polymerase sigma-70 factor (ECF subfamily)